MLVAGLYFVKFQQGGSAECEARRADARYPIRAESGGGILGEGQGQRLCYYNEPSGVVANLELGERSGSGGRAPSGGPGAEPLVGGSGGRSPPEAESFFVLGYPKGGAIFHLTSKFRKLRKQHIFQVTSDRTSQPTCPPGTHIQLYWAWADVVEVVSRAVTIFDNRFTNITIYEMRHFTLIRELLTIF